MGNLIDNIKNMFLGTPENMLHTAYGDFNLAKEKDVRRLKKVVIQLNRETDALTRKDIADWRNAWQLAINIDFPDRRPLYDIYRDVEIDLHLSGCIEQRKGFVKARTFKLTDGKGREVKEAMRYFDKEWFKQLISYILDSLYWGHSLVELGNVITDDEGMPYYDRVTLIPRKHVIPEYHRVVTGTYESWQSGINYQEEPFSPWLIEAGQPDSLGMFLKAALQTIPKKNMLAFWDTFGEIFGMPMRIARTSSRDQKDIDKLDRMLQNSGTKLTAVMGMDTEIQFIETGKNDSYNVYDKRIDRANSELSKLVIGQTMTIEDGSSLSQSETHLKVFQNLIESDCDMLRDIINNQLLPRMVRHGFPLVGLRFDWDYSTDYTPEQQVAYETMIINAFDVDPAYFTEKYGVPCNKRKDNSSASLYRKMGKNENGASSFFD